MSKPADLSAFPIPRKGGAKPILGEIGEAKSGAGEGGDAEPSPPVAVPAAADKPEPTAAARASSTTKATSVTPNPVRPVPAPRAPAAPLPTYGQTVATTVKLDENRYLRLMEAGKPAPGRLKRRTIQDMLIEALDEWFERRQL